MFETSQEEKQKPFAGKINVYKEFPFDEELFPQQARAYLSPRENTQPYYFVAEENDLPTGFAVIDIDKDNDVTFLYRYVSKDHRRRGVGQQLRDEVYDWLSRERKVSIESGINDVVKVLDSGEVIPVLETKNDGGWRSYVSMTRSKKEGQIVQHKVTQASMHENGRVGLSFETFVDGEEKELLPENPQDLIQFLYEQGIFPSDKRLDELLDEAKKQTIIYFVNGRVLTQCEWLMLFAKR